MMHGDRKKDRRSDGGSGSGRKRMESRRGSRMEVVGKERGVRYKRTTTWREGERERGREGERKTGAGEAMRRKSTAHQGEIEMMEGSQLRHRDRRIETQ